MRTRPSIGRRLGAWLDAVPARPRAASGEAIGLVLVLLAFTRLHAVVATDVAVATGNASALQSLERRLHLDVEPGLNRWLVGHDALITPAVLVYRLYYVVLLGVLVWIFLRHADVHRQVRRTFVAMTGLALVVFRVLPMSPPRFALAGVVDVVAEHDLLGGAASHGAGSLTAMPSLHVGWSAWAAYAAWSALRPTHPRAAALAWLFPAVMVADVLVTGNHYLLDVVGSGVLLVASIALARGWGRLAARLAARRDRRPIGG